MSSNVFTLWEGKRLNGHFENKKKIAIFPGRCRARHPADALGRRERHGGGPAEEDQGAAREVHRHPRQRVWSG